MNRINAFASTFGLVIMVSVAAISLTSAAAQPAMRSDSKVPMVEDLKAAEKSGYMVGSFSGATNDRSRFRWVTTGYWLTNINDAKQSSPIFEGNLTMSRSDGAMPKLYWITQFKLLDISSNGAAKVFRGTTTIKSDNVSLASVPTTIKVGQKNIDLSFDPSVGRQYFGDTAIYGTIGKAADIIKAYNLQAMLLC